MELESAVAELVGVLAQATPGCGPAIFPQSFSGVATGGLTALCADEGQARRLLQRWSAAHPEGANPARVVFRTTVDAGAREVRIVGVEAPQDEAHYVLGNLERSMELQVSGSESEVSLAVARFHELNGSQVGIAEQRLRFSEAYQVAYTIKVLISNMPMQVLWGRKGNVQLPFAPEVDNFDAAIASVLGSGSNNGSAKKASKGQAATKKSGDSDSDSESDDDDDESANGGSASKHKRRRKRGGGGGGSQTKSRKT